MPSFGEERGREERWQALPGLERGAAGTGAAALTFDDGPDPDGTPAVLDALDAAEMKATFFMTGEQLIRNIALGREVAERGHEIGLHGFVHLRHDDMSPTAARDDIARALGTVEAATTVRARWCRPPYGLFAEGSYAACAKLELRPVYWSSSGLDYETVSAERIADLAARDLVEGAIVLLHDSARYAPRASPAATAEAIPLIAAAARERGLALRTLGEIAGEAGS